MAFTRSAVRSRLAPPFLPIYLISINNVLFQALGLLYLYTTLVHNFRESPLPRASNNLIKKGNRYSFRIRVPQDLGRRLTIPDPDPC